VIEAAGEAAGLAEGVTAHFFDDLLTLGRLPESDELMPEYLADTQINLFTTRFELNWLLVMPDK
jgi:hypothetical protein